MRDALISELTEIAADDERVWALTGDLGIGLFDEFERRAPGRFLNVGIAEQAMVGLAAGLAYAGQKPLAYSIAPFLTARAHEQVRVDVAMARAPVVLAGVGGGMAYGYLGPTHHATEDLAAMRMLPHMTVLAPADPGEARLADRAAFAHDGPVYLRLGKNGEPRLWDRASFELGRAVELRSGSDVALISTGTILAEVIAAADQLAGAGVQATVLHASSLAPFDAPAVVRAARRTGCVISVEEHVISGGLGSATAEAMAEASTGARLIRLGLCDTFADEVGSQSFLLSRHGLDADSIAARARHEISDRPAILGRAA